MTSDDIREVLLTIVEQRAGQPSLQSGSVLREAERVLNPRGLEEEQAVLTYWGDLFRNGYLAWGYDLSNSAPPFCHITDRGRRVLATLSRDPANPGGYKAYLAKKAALSSIAASYLQEALETYNSGSHKAAAVMIGASAESIVLELRDAVVVKLSELAVPVPAKLNDWRMKTVLGALEELIEVRRKQMNGKLFESFQAYWPAFTQQIRAVRNDAGHPTSVDPIDEQMVHASLLVFPELAQLAKGIREFVDNDMA